MLASPTALKDYLFTDPEAEYLTGHYDPSDISHRELSAPAGARYLRKPDENEGRSHGAVGPRAFVMPLMDVDQMNLGPRFSARTRFKLPRMCQRPKAIMDVLADHLGDIGMEDGWDDPQVTPDGSIKCGCLAEFPDITAWRAHLAQTIIDNIDASKEAYEALNRVDVEATREAGEMTASLIVLDAAENRDGDGSDMTCAPSNPTAGTTGNMSE